MSPTLQRGSGGRGRGRPAAVSSAQVEKLVKPKPHFLHLLKSAGAQKETFTVKEVHHHLGQYIKARKLYDEKQQHIVHCCNDPLGELFGVQKFSVKDPRRLLAMISENLMTADLEEEKSSNGHPSEQQGKKNKSDRISLTFESNSWQECYKTCFPKKAQTVQDYWKCSQCGEMNPLVPRCWSLRKDWLQDQAEQKIYPIERKTMEYQWEEGIDNPDGKKETLNEAQDYVIAKKEEEGIQRSEPQEIENFSQLSTSGRIASGSQEENSEHNLPLLCAEPCVICETRPKKWMHCQWQNRAYHSMFSMFKKAPEEKQALTPMKAANSDDRLDQFQTDQ